MTLPQYCWLGVEALCYTAKVTIVVLLGYGGNSAKAVTLRIVSMLQFCCLAMKTTGCAAYETMEALLAYLWHLARMLKDGVIFTSMCVKIGFLWGIQAAITSSILSVSQPRWLAKCSRAVNSNKGAAAGAILFACQFVMTMQCAFERYFQGTSGSTTLNKSVASVAASCTPAQSTRSGVPLLHLLTWHMAAAVCACSAVELSIANKVLCWCRPAHPSRAATTAQHAC